MTKNLSEMKAKSIKLMLLLALSFAVALVNAQVTVTKSELNNLTSKQVDQPFTYVINYSTPNTSTAYTNLRICDELPQGLVFLGVSAATGDMQSLSYNASTNSVCAVFNSPWNGGSGQFQIVVKFASTVFNGTVASNTAAVSSDQYNGTSNTINITAISSNPPPVLTTGVFLNKYANGSNVYNNGLMLYALDYGIGGLNPVSSLTVIDQLPAGFILTQLSAGIFSGTNIPFNVYYKTNLNSAYSLLPGSPYNTGSGVYRNIDFLPTNVYITEIKIEYPSLPAGTLFTKENFRSLDISGYFNNTLANLSNGANIQNCATITATGTGAGASSGCSSNQTFQTSSYLDVGVGKAKIDYQVDLVPGGTYRYFIGIGDGYANSSDIINPVIADLLPPEFIYVGNVTISGNGFPSGSNQPTTTVIPNFNGTGRTLVRWAWGPSNPLTLVRSGASKSFQIRFDIQVRSVPTGTYRNDAYISVQGTPNHWSSYNVAPVPIIDTFDFDGDGNTTESIANSYVPFNVINPSGAALVSEKWVKGSLDAGYSRFPTSGRTTPGGMADYKLKLKNAGTVALKTIKVIDIFPYVGDRGVIDLSSRGSEWQPFFVGPVTGPTGATIYYSTSNDPCRTDINFTAAGCDAGAVWTTTLPTDITTVRSIKLDLGSIVLQPGDSLEFNWPMRAPIDAPTNGEIAWNSFGYTATRNDNNSVLPSSEPIKVGISVNPIQPAAYGNYVWYDANGDGIQNEPASNGINGVKVDLYFAKGATPNIATDSLVTFTITSSNAGNPGYYLFPVLNPGNYYAVFHKPLNNLVITTPNVGSDNTINSDGIQTIISGDTLAITAITNLIAGETDYTWDLGLASNCTKPNAGVNQNSCPNSSVTLVGSPTTGTWSAQAGNPTGATVGATTSGSSTINFSGLAVGTYNFIYTTGSSCSDTLSVAVKSTSTSSVNVTVCSNQLPYLWNGVNRNTAGTYTFTTTNSVGCDSLATLNLTVKSTSTSSVNVTVCSNQLPYLWNGVNRNAAGTYTFTTTNSVGCDSLATLNLTVNTAVTAGTDGSTTECNGSGNTVTLANVITGETVGGVWTRLSGTGGIFNAGSGTIVITSGTTTSTFRYIVTGTAPCTNDTSIVILNITSAPTAGTDGSSSICSNSTNAIDLFNIISGEDAGGTWTRLTGTGGLLVNNTFTPSSGVTTSTFRYVIGGSGCPYDTSVATLTVKSTSTSTTNVSVCSNQLPYSWNSNSYNAAGSYIVNLTNSVGCDSAATLVLTLKTTSASSTPISICSSGLPYTWNGTVYNSAGTYNKTFTNAAGCDSIATLVLTVKASSTSSTPVSVCSNTLPYVWNGTSYNSAGTYNKTFTNAAGCDSIATLVLTVKASSTSSTPVSVCSNTLPYVWNGTSYNAAGTYTKTLTNASGCDSVATLVLTVKAISTSTTSTYICNSTLPFTWNGKTYNASATDTVRLTNIVGCDSLAILRLVVQTPNCFLQASYTINQVAQCVQGNSFSFTSTVTGNTGVLSYLWNFGDGTTSTAANPTHTYATAGEYDVTLVVTEANACIGSCTAYASAKQVYIGPKPTVNFDWQYNGSCLTYDFNSNSTVSMGWITNRFWDFGDGQTSTQNNPLATFTAPGIYNVKLVITTNYGCKDSIIFPVNIINKCTNPGAGGTTGSTGGGGVSPAPCSGGWWSQPATTNCDSTLRFNVSNTTAGATYTWNFGDGTSGTGNPTTHKYAAPGNYLVKLVVEKLAPSACKDSVSYNVYVSSCSVTSGGGGGVESKTLGDVIAVRLYGNAINSKTETTAYTSNNMFTHSGVIVNGTNNLTLSDLVPTTVTNTDAAYVSTPTDLVNFTNAVEILAVDYTKGNSTKAVAFGTKTLGDVYNHTKPICDRLKGAELQEVKNITVNGFNLIAYKVRQRTGETEYAINLSAGTATNRNSISLQSNWFTDSYQHDEKLYNFQLWAVSYEMVTAMAKDIVTKLQANGVINTVTNSDLPKAYISKGSRQGTDLFVTVNNNTAATSGYFELHEKVNENAAVTTRQVAFTVAANAATNVTVPVSDNYEGDIYVYVNNKLTDLVYLADGTWNLDYNKLNTSISSFDIANESNPTTNTDEHRLLRNVTVTGTSKDYITIYKTMMGGGLEQNVADYKSIMFHTNAVGANRVQVTLIKKSITNWNDQYTYTMELDGDKEYGINLNQFKSSKYAQELYANDIVAVNFSFLTSRNTPTAMNINLSKARFSNTEIATAIEVKTVSVYPNPSSGKFSVSFTNEVATPLVLKVVEVSTGRTIKTQFINALKGKNQVSIAIDNTTFTSGLYSVTLEGDGAKFKAAKLMMNKF